MKKLFVIIVLFWWFMLFLGSWFSYFDKKVYCKISKNNIIISLKNSWSTCQSYTKSIELSMKKVYRDILAIQWYINKKEDIGYRKPIKDQKVETLNKLQNMRLNILSHINDFEKNLFNTSKSYFLDNVSVYQRKIRTTLKYMLISSGPNKDKYVKLLQDQLQVIEDIAASQTFEEMDKYMQKYVYIKQQILWK